ncbi:GIY-YIG nuclease family protein [Thioalkalivibrio sp. HK1]|uniref:GIY-YIG nuclease family protein n=1 Tax=Thioalkalivibrio sp. HK1 TaxID=1469245 RepID=UPI000472F839|nr:GIY-YIG nuclease family protein [Thioalkalivibrio sp. HK1]
MSDRGEKITIYIPGGLSKRGIKVADIVNWTGQVFVCQREEIENLESEWGDEIERQGIYILFGGNDTGRKPAIYIAETENVKIQLRLHLAETDFWEIAFILINKDENINKTHFKYLEARMMDLAKNADKLNLENRSIPKLPPISRSDQSMADRYLEHVITLLDTLGFSYLERREERRLPEKTNEAWENALIDADGNLTTVSTSSKYGYHSTTKNSPKRIRTEYPRVKEMMVAGVMKAGDIIWFKRTPDRRAVLTMDGRCEYEGKEMSLAEYAKIASGWSGVVSIYDYLIHGSSGVTIGGLRNQLSVSPSRARSSSISTDQLPSRINLPNIKDMVAAGVMKIGDVVWFKKTPDQKAILISDERCKYHGEEMSLVDYGKIVSGWTAVNVYQYFIHGPSGQTIEYLRDRLIESTSDVRLNSVSPNRPQPKAKPTDSLSCIRLYFNAPLKKIRASGIYSSDAFLVLAGSLGAREVSPRLIPWGRAKRESLIARGEIKYQGDQIYFMQDVKFKTPSTAAVVISGASQNGRIVWKDKDGKTLKEIQEESS